MNVDRAVECVACIVDNNRCSACGKAEGCRVRYPCGHTACADCVISAVNCLVCSTPPLVSGSAKLNDCFTKKVDNASLLQESQDVFNIDVFKKQRLSDQLRIEKELFPKCIQAPMKYENKRRSTITSNKENRKTSVFPGEGVSFSKENSMENTISYVQQWLNKNQKNYSRKPFADLSVNHQTNKNISNFKVTKAAVDENNQFSPIKKNIIKRTHFKTTLKNNPPTNRKRNSVLTLNNYSKKAKKLPHSDNLSKNVKNQKENENDESGIFIDDEPIVIDDSQVTAIDKDNEALLAVIEADKKAGLNSTSITFQTRDDSILGEITLSDKFQSKSNLFTKVPFYKKSSLVETCKYCSHERPMITQPKEFKITIENNSFITTVKVLNTNDKSAEIIKKSVPVQTNISEVNETSYMEDTHVVEAKKYMCKEILTQSRSYDARSEDLFAEEGKDNKNESQKAFVGKESLVIDESDSDIDIENSGPMQVTVDIHRSCEASEYGILAEVENHEEHSSRARRAPRGHTPNSTDSSDKENYNPNRAKGNRPGKKKRTKK